MGTLGRWAMWAGMAALGLTLAANAAAHPHEGEAPLGHSHEGAAQHGHSHDRDGSITHPHEAGAGSPAADTAGDPVLVPMIGLPAVAAAPGSLILAQTRVKAKQGYNSDYIFGLTKSIADSTLVPALKVPVFILTIPFDLVLLPFALIGGFFG